jgi:hypothetical protein
MGVKRSRRKKDWRTARASRQMLRPVDRQAIVLARRMGLYLLVENDGERWVTYSLASGLELMSYWPGTGFYVAGAHEGRSFDWSGVLRMAARISRGKDKQTPPRAGRPG